MTEQAPTPNAVQLFLNADTKINEIRERAEMLMAEDLELKHKMDLVIQRQDQLKERFEHSSATGHKTWEAVQQILASMNKVDTRLAIAEDTATKAREESSKVSAKFDKLVFATVITVCVSILLAVLAALLKYGVHI